LCSCETISHVIDNLSNETKVKVTHIRMVKINNEILVKDVLLIQKFAYNLISISKLLFSHDIEVVFC